MLTTALLAISATQIVIPILVVLLVVVLVFAFAM